MKKTIVCLLAILLFFHLKKVTAQHVALNEKEALPEAYRSYSNTSSKSADTAGATSMQVFPSSSVHDYCILAVFSERKQKTECFLSDEAGKVLQRKKVMLLSGFNNISWDMSSYTAGVYYLTSESQKQSKVKVTKL
jgi:hypothetical protein